MNEHQFPWTFAIHPVPVDYGWLKPMLADPTAVGMPQAIALQLSWWLAIGCSSMALVLAFFPISRRLSKWFAVASAVTSALMGLALASLLLIDAEFVCWPDSNLKCLLKVIIRYFSPLAAATLIFWFDTLAIKRKKGMASDSQLSCSNDNTGTRG
jgi:hypothetical protein